MLPDLPYKQRKSKQSQVEFGGYNHNVYAKDGEIWDMKNMCSDGYPYLAPRKPRHLIRSLVRPEGLYARDGLYWVETGRLCRDGELVDLLASGQKSFAGVNAYVVVWPDKKYYNSATGESGYLEAKYRGTATIGAGTYAGETAEANTIKLVEYNYPYFRAGDAVTISGCVTHPENNKTAIIREVDGMELRFYENTFTVAEGDPDEDITIERTVPDMDFIFDHGNRLWGCKGDTIMCSKLGDPFNWNVFDGLSTDSWQVEVGSTGDFTGGCSYDGFPMFFKEDMIYKVYGEYASEFQVVDTVGLGVEAGSHKSLAVAGGALFYLSRTGIMAYNGSLPQSLAAAFGSERYRNAVGGSDGTKYYVSMEDMDGNASLFVYDTRWGQWHREDDVRVIDFAWNNDLYLLTDQGTDQGKVLLIGGARNVPEGAQAEQQVESMVEFGDFEEGSPDKKVVSKLRLRLEAEAGARVTVQIRYDSRGPWRSVGVLGAAKKTSRSLQIKPRRCDHYRLRLSGVGMWRLEAMTREVYCGSEK